MRGRALQGTDDVCEAADIDDNNVVDVEDVLAVLAAEYGGNGPADVNSGGGRGDRLVTRASCLIY